MLLSEQIWRKEWEKSLCSILVEENNYRLRNVLKHDKESGANFFSLGPSYRIGRVYKWNWGLYVCPSSLRIWSLFLLVGFTDPYNHTDSESLWCKLFKNHRRTQIERQRQWQRKRKRQRQSAWKTQHMLYIWNPDDLLIPNMMIYTSPWSSCSRQSPWLPGSGHTISSIGPSVSPFWDF